MKFTTTPFFYRNLLKVNDVIQDVECYDVTLIDGMHLFESVAFLNAKLKPHLNNFSDIYTSGDGAGSSKYQNIAIYKAISEALERWAFYATADSENEKVFCFDENPSTTGMAAYPGLTARMARKNAILEAQERWALHEFWRGNLPVVEHKTNIKDLIHYEIGTSFDDVHISLLSYKSDAQFLYAFAADSSLTKSFEHALIELARNIRVMDKFKKENKIFSEFNDISDKRLFYFSTQEGNDLFNSKINSSPSSPSVSAQLICDKEIKGPWSEYTRVWRYLYANSFPDSDTDHTFFMF